MLHMLQLLIGALVINFQLHSRASAQINGASSSPGQQPFTTYTAPINGGTIQTIKNPSGTRVSVQQIIPGNSNRPTFVSSQQTFTSGNTNQTAFASSFSGNNPSAFNQFTGNNPSGFNQFAGNNPSGFNQLAGNNPSGFNQFAGNNPSGFNQFPGNNLFGFNQFAGYPFGFNQFAGNNQFYTIPFGFLSNQYPYRPGGFVSFVPLQFGTGTTPFPSSNQVSASSGYPTQTYCYVSSGNPTQTTYYVTSGKPTQNSCYVTSSTINTPTQGMQTSVQPSTSGIQPSTTVSPFKPGTFIANVPLELVTSDKKPNQPTLGSSSRGPYKPNTFIPKVPVEFVSTGKTPVSQSFTTDGFVSETIFPVRSSRPQFSSQTTSPVEAAPSSAPQLSPPGLSLSISGLLGLGSLPNKLPISKPNPANQPFLSFLAELSSSKKKQPSTPTEGFKPSSTELNVVPFEPSGPFFKLRNKVLPSDSTPANAPRRPATAYGLPGNV